MDIHQNIGEVEEEDVKREMEAWPGRQEIRILSSEERGRVFPGGSQQPCQTGLRVQKINDCVATLQGQAGPWYLCRRKNIHRAVGMSGMLLFMGGRATHTARCVSICMSHVVAPAPQHGTHCGTCPLVCLSSSSPWESHKYQRGTKLARCQNIIT